LPFIERFARNVSMPADEEHGQVVPADVKETRAVVGLRGRSQSGPLSLRVILATRDTSSRIWFLRTIGELLSKCSATDSPSSVRIQVYLTGEAAQKVDLSNKVPEDPTSSKGSASSAEKIDLPEERPVELLSNHRISSIRYNSIEFIESNFPF
jgi:hypothetical protein